jgi:cation-transporting ATPase I
LAHGTVEAIKNEISGRRTWASGDHAYVEARGLRDTRVGRDYVDALEKSLTATEGVRWAAVNGVLGDVIVDFDPDHVAVARLREIVAEVERAYGMSDHHRDEPAHPGDFEQVLDRLVELGADFVGAGIGVLGQLTPALRLPAEMMAIPAAADLLPAKLKQRMDERFGAIRVELVMSLLGSVLSAATQAPLSTVVDGALRAVEIREAVAARRIWHLTRARAGRRLCDGQGRPAAFSRPTTGAVAGRGHRTVCQARQTGDENRRHTGVHR